VTGATGYYLKRALASGGPYAVIAQPASAGWNDLMVANYTTYFYVVSAVNEAGQSANSAEVRLTPQPSVALGAAFAAGGNQLLLSWPAWATNYNVYAATNLQPPVVWQIVTNLPQTNNGIFLLSLPVTGNAQQFFRLFGP
jgi:cellulose 1,4-beta-cellobiosidase